MKVRLLLSVAVAWWFSFTLLAQETRTGAAPRTVVIRFYAQVTDASVAKMMDTIDREISDGTRRVIILISSPGGSVSAGLTAYNYLKGVPAEIITHNIGSVNSIATVIYCASSRRYTVPQARFLIHSVSANFPANSTLDEGELDERLKMVRQDVEAIASVIAGTIKKSAEEIQRLMINRTVLTVEEAKKWGLVHEVREELYEPGSRVIAISADIRPESSPQASIGRVEPLPFLSIQKEMPILDNRSSSVLQSSTDGL